MGLMKEFLMEQTSELASKLGIGEELFYTNADLTKMAWNYARYILGSKEVPDKEVIYLEAKTTAVLLLASPKSE